VAAITETIDPDAQVDGIWPDTTASGRPYGWKGVSSWCAELATQLEVFMRGVAGREYDILVVHLDCSMAHNLGIQNPCPPADTTSVALGEVILSWLSRTPTCWLVTLTPSLTIDAWIAAALDPPYVPPIPLECDPNAENELARRRLLPRKSGGVKKPRAKYKALVSTMVKRWAHVKAVCGQAAAFEVALRTALLCVTRGEGPH